MCDACMDDHARPRGRRQAAAACVNEARASRRCFLLLGLGIMAGCVRRSSVVGMPGPPWPEHAPPEPPASFHDPIPEPAPSALNQPVLARSKWATVGPVPARMDPMTTISRITLHHDGMDPFYDTDARASAARIELIRQLHRRRGWADIGYHFVIDREGRIWEARPLAWQGAHVKDHNPGNIGIVALGNFDEQAPSEAQLAAIESFITALRRAYDVPGRNVHTHQEWPDAATACPGRSLQQWATGARRAGRL